MWFRPDKETSIATPSILLFPDRIKENIGRMIAIAGNAERLRTHVKTHKIAELIRLQQQEGIHRFKCATLSGSGFSSGCRAGGKGNQQTEKTDLP